MNIILFGAPGSGKGTQAINLVKKFNLYKLSTGDLLRDEIKNQTSLGQKLKVILKKGQFVSDDIMNELIENIISKEKNFNRVVYDGYPRTLNQAISLDNILDKYKQEIHCVLNLNVDKAILEKRILGRLICKKCNLTFNEFFNPPQIDKYECKLAYLEKRSDDNHEIVKNRYNSYLNKSLPIINYYKEKKLVHEINGMDDISSIYAKIIDIIGPLDAWLYTKDLYKLRF